MTVFFLFSLFISVYDFNDFSKKSILIFGKPFVSVHCSAQKSISFLTAGILQFFFRNILEISKNFNFLICCHCRLSNFLLIGFFYSSRRRRVENVSFVTHLYLGKKKVIENKCSNIFRKSIFLTNKRKRLRVRKVLTSPNRFRIT